MPVTTQSTLLAPVRNHNCGGFNLILAQRVKNVIKTFVSRLATLIVTVGQVPRKSRNAKHFALVH